MKDRRRSAGLGRVHSTVVSLWPFTHVSLQEIESLLVNWTGPDLGGFGELVLEGSFKVHRVKKERAFFLFDKMLLIAKKRMEQFVYSTHIFVSNDTFEAVAGRVCTPASQQTHMRPPTWLPGIRGSLPWLTRQQYSDLQGFSRLSLCLLLHLQCCNLLLVENLKDPLCFRVSDQTIPKQQHVVQVRETSSLRPKSGSKSDFPVLWSQMQRPHCMYLLPDFLFCRQRIRRRSDCGCTTSRGWSSKTIPHHSHTR